MPEFHPKLSYEDLHWIAQFRYMPSSNNNNKFVFIASLMRIPSPICPRLIDTTFESHNLHSSAAYSTSKGYIFVVWILPASKLSRGEHRRESLPAGYGMNWELVLSRLVRASVIDWWWVICKEWNSAAIILEDHWCRLGKGTRILPVHSLSSFFRKIIKPTILKLLFLCALFL